MAFYDTTWYLNAGDQSTTGYYAVTKRPQNTSVAAGVVRRQFTAPAVNSERCFVCIVAGTTANVTDATWVLTRGAKTTDGTVTWQECTGQAALNGDLTNTATWAQVKASVGANAVLGQIIKRSNNASYQICTTAGAMSVAEPAFSDTAGVTTTDTTAVWTSLGVVGNFSGGGAPHARLTNVLIATWMGANNTCYVGDNHTESQASNITLTTVPQGTTSGQITKIICHNHSGSYPPAASDITIGATISATTTNTLTFICVSVYVYGITFKGGSGSTGSGAFVTLTSAAPGNQSWGYFENCSFQVGTTSASGGYISILTASVVWNNCTISLGHTAGKLNVVTGGFQWRNTGAILAGGSAVPIVLFDTLTFVGLATTLEALDLSQITGTIFVNSSASVSSVGFMLIKDCKLHASATITNPLHTGMTVQVVRSDSSGTAYKSTRYTLEGTETTETSITRVGGAVDPAGQAQSRKIVTSINAQWLRPFAAEPYAIWNAVTGANVTVTVYGTVNSALLPNNDDIWLELSYLGSASSPLGTLATTTKNQLWSANAAVASDGSSWNGGGSGAGWSLFKLTKTLSSPQPGMAGYIHVRVRTAKASTTYYIDPQVVLS